MLSVKLNVPNVIIYTYLVPIWPHLTAVLETTKQRSKVVGTGKELADSWPAIKTHNENWTSVGLWWEFISEKSKKTCFFSWSIAWSTAWFLILKDMKPIFLFLIVNCAQMYGKLKPIIIITIRRGFPSIENGAEGFWLISLQVKM